MADGSQPAGDAADVDDTFVALYRRHVTPIYSYVYSRVSDRADTEDLTEQVFTEALAGWERYEELGSVQVSMR